MDHLKNSLSLRKLVVFQIDSLLILCASYLAIAIKFNGKIPTPWLNFLQEAVFVTILCQLIFFINDLYSVDGPLATGAIIWRIVLALGISSLMLMGFYLFFPGLELSKGLFLYSMLISLVLICFWRVLFGWIVVNMWPKKNIFILGTGNLAHILAEELMNKPYSPYELKGLLHAQAQAPGRTFMGVSVCGVDDESTQALIKGKKIHKLIVAIEQRRENFPIEFLLNCKLQGIEVMDCPNFYERISGKLLLTELRPSWIIFSSGFKEKKFYQASKSVLDVIFAVVGLIIASPIMLLLAISIKLDNPGPVFFKQERSGYQGKVFVLYKFRSMFVDAEAKSGPVWAMENDRRITRVGKVIRKLRLDELPQMFNVLKGDMSFVGPRPERPFFINKLQKAIPYYDQRLIVKPGITGWAAVQYQYASSVESALEKLQYDLYYIKNRSLVLDMQIILKTVQVMITGKGAA